MLLLLSFAATLAVTNKGKISDAFNSKKSETIDNVVNDLTTEEEDQISDYSSSKSVPDSKFTTSGWIPDWASPAGLASLKAQDPKIDTVSPVWYEINEDGSLKNKRPNNASQIETYTKDHGIELIPAIAMFDHELFSTVLNENLSEHVDAIVDEVNSKNYAGIDLDYESTQLNDKEKYFEFLQKLSKKLHSRNKTLIVTVLAQWDKPTEYSSFKETRQVQDWTVIAKHSDLIRIMAYDYTFSLSPNPGPIAPLSWMEDVLDYAIQKVPREKLVLGIHLYSYEWFCEKSKYDNNECTLEFIPFSFLNIGEQRQNRSYTYNTTKSVVGKFGDDLTDFEGEKIYRYQKTNPQTNILEERTLVYIDPAGVQARIDLAKKYGIKGVVFWRLGGEDGLLSDSI